MGRPNYERVLCILRDGVEDVEREKKNEQKRGGEAKIKKGNEKWGAQHQKHVHRVVKNEGVRGGAGRKPERCRGMWD